MSASACVPKDSTRSVEVSPCRLQLDLKHTTPIPHHTNPTPHQSHTTLRHPTHSDTLLIHPLTRHKTMTHTAPNHVRSCLSCSYDTYTPFTHATIHDSLLIANVNVFHVPGVSFPLFYHLILLLLRAAPCFRSCTAFVDDTHNARSSHVSKLNYILPLPLPPCYSPLTAPVVDSSRNVCCDLAQYCMPHGAVASVRVLSLVILYVSYLHSLSLE